MKDPIWKAALMSVALAGFLTVSTTAQDRTLAEFKKYVKDAAGDRISDQQLDELVKAVDKDGDGTISEAEFEARMEAFQKVMGNRGERPDRQGSGEGRPRGDQPRSNRWEQMNKRMQAQLENAGISPGKSLPDVSGLDIDGKPFRLADLKGHYSVIVSGCLT